MNANINTTYMGLKLNSPLVVGACSLTRNPEFVREAAIAGAGAVVLPSLFEEQVVHDLVLAGAQVTPLEEQIDNSRYNTQEDKYNGGPQAYIDLISRLKNSTGIPVIASLNGYTGGSWLRIAEQIEQAGANALEVTLEPDITDPSVSGEVAEEQMLSNLRELCDLVSIPVAIKLSSFHTNVCNLAWRVLEVGGSAIVCFAHEPVWRVELGKISATPCWDLTQAGNINPTISGLLKIRSQGPAIDLAASGGVSSVPDLIATIMAGADAVMVTSEVYRSGPDIISHMNDGLLSYINRHGFTSFSELRACRPQVKPLLRSMQSNCITDTEPFRDPTPHVLAQAGDRWGHPR